MDRQLKQFEKELKTILIGCNNYKDIMFNTYVIQEINVINYGLEIILEDGTREVKPIPL